jgi:hypothetical protein
MAKFLIASWNNGTAAKALAEALDAKLMKKDSSAPIPRSVTHIINLGLGTESEGAQRIFFGCTQAMRVVNNLTSVAVAQSKVRTFQRIRERNARILPLHWFNAEDANYCCLVGGLTVVARTHDRGSSGSGIVVLTPDEARVGRGLPAAQLYTKAINKRREYRVHVGNLNGRMVTIDVTRKIRRPGVDDTNRPFIWNHDNEFIFVRDGVNPDTIPQSLIARAQVAVQDLGLQFGAVDIIVERGGTLLDANCYVLEVNTSPGMEGTTLARYVEFFQKYAAQEQHMETQWSRLDFGDTATQPVGEPD